MYLVAIGGNRFGDRNVGLVGCIRTSIVAGVCLAPRIQSVSFNRGHNGNNERPKRVVKHDIVFESSHCGDGTNKGWIFSSKMGHFSDATFTFPKSVAKSAIWLKTLLRKE
jgi:hypothetical protein